MVKYLFVLRLYKYIGVLITIVKWINIVNVNMKHVQQLFQDYMTAIFTLDQRPK